MTPSTESDTTHSMMRCGVENCDCGFEMSASQPVDIAIAESEERFRFLADTIPQIVWTATPDGKRAYFNKRWFDFSGLTYEQSKGIGWQAVLHPDDLPVFRKRWAKALQSESPFEAELRFKRASDQAYRWQLCRAVPQRDKSGRIVQWIGTTTDIHDQKLTFDELQKARLNLEARVEERTAELLHTKKYAEAVLDNIADGIVVCDAGGTLTVFNRASREMHGVSERRLSANDWAPSYNLYKSDGVTPMEQSEIPLYRAFKGEIIRNVEMVIAPEGLPRRTLVANGRKFDDEHGKSLGAVVAMHDITELKRIEAELRTAKDAAESATKAKSEFLANMSHEIRTPMTAILGYADLLEGNALREEDRVNYVNVIRRNGEHLLQVLNDILDISKIEAGKMTLEQLACSPLSIVTEVESLMRIRAMEKNISFSVESCGRVADSIISDPTRLRQVLLNLVSNAIKFTDTGTVKVTVSVKPEGTRQKICFDVCDTGIGISPEQKARMFLPFGQGDGSTTRQFGGTGLGLALCQRLAVMLGGELSVKSEVGVGSTFTLVMDAAIEQNQRNETESGGATDAKKISNGSHARYRLLLAEDSPDNRKLAIIHLQQAGFQVDSVHNGREAVDAVVRMAAISRPYDLVLMDMQMPVFDGYAATAELRRLGYHALPIVALTAHAMAGQRERCLDSGCNDYAMKPIHLDSLLETVRRNIASAQRSNGPTTVDATPEVDESPIRSTRENDRIMKRILGEYIADLPEMVARMADHLAKRQMSDLQNVVHQLKGSGGGYGFARLTELAAETEARILREEPLEQIQRNVQQLSAYVRRIADYDASREVLRDTSEPAENAA